jgi:thymidine kinase
MLRFELICGPMFSGKTKEALRRASCLESIGLKILRVGSVVDIRSTSMRTHDGAVAECVKVHNLCDVLVHPDLNRALSVIVVDELQFFPDVVEFLQKAEALSQPLTVIASSLSGDFMRHRWRSLDEVSCFADSVTYLHAYCLDCGDTTAAPFTKKRTTTGPWESEVCVGSSETYVPVCRRHYLSWKLAAKQSADSNALNSPMNARLIDHGTLT